MSDHADERLPLRPVEFEILVSLGKGPRHGYAILQAAEERTEAAPGVTTLYRALQRLHEEGLIAPVDGDAGEDGSREVYALTPLGRAVGRAEARRLSALLGRASEGILRQGGG